MAIATLTDLSTRIRKADCGIEIVSFNGLKLETSIGIFTIGPDETYEKTNLYLNHEVITKKQLEALLKTKIED